jgi:hypothetical protein
VTQIYNIYIVVNFIFYIKLHFFSQTVSNCCNRIVSNHIINYDTFLVIRTHYSCVIFHISYFIFTAISSLLIKLVPNCEKKLFLRFKINSCITDKKIFYPSFQKFNTFYACSKHIIMRILSTK